MSVLILDDQTRQLTLGQLLEKMDEEGLRLMDANGLELFCLKRSPRSPLFMTEEERNMSPQEWLDANREMLDERAKTPTEQCLTTKELLEHLNNVAPANGEA